MELKIGYKASAEHAVARLRATGPTGPPHSADLDLLVSEVRDDLQIAT